MRKYKKKKDAESTVQTEIMNALGWHPKIAWAFVTTTGMVKRRGSWITLGIPGMPDIIGQLKDGRLFGIEVKKPGITEGTVDQENFVATILRYNGVAGFADSVKAALDILDSEE